MTTIRDLLNEREPNFAEEAELKQEIEETTLLDEDDAFESEFAFAMPHSRMLPDYDPHADPADLLAFLTR